MSGLQVTVRQIGNYPATQAARADDLVLLQQGGLGGPYVTTTPQGLLAPLGASSLAVGLATPAEWTRGNLAAQYHVLPRAGDILWNAYHTPSGYRTWLNGLSARLTFSPTTGGLGFGMAPEQHAGQAIAGFVPAFTIDPAGGMRLHGGTLRVARDPGSAMEVATMGWVNRASVRQFNGRSGNVRLDWSDVYQALGVAGNDRVATSLSVDRALANLLVRNPFVFSWNGRTGNVFLQLADIEQVYFAPGARPRAPDPPLYDASNQIATTAWVTRYLTEKWWSDSTRTFAPIASPEFIGKPLAPLPPSDSDDAQIATTQWVRTVLEDIGAGVLQWNGRSGFVTLQLSDVNDVFTALGAIPLAPTAVPGTATQQIATTAFVTAAAQDIIDNSVWTWNTRKGDVVLTLQDILNSDGQQRTALGTSYPATPSSGQFFFDPATKKLEIWNGAQWDVAGGAVEISDTEPLTSYDGKLWWDSDVGDLFIYYQGPSGGQWVIANASAGSPGPPGPPGTPGLQGVQGPPGPALNPQGTVPSGAPGTLPATGDPGDFWVDSATGDGWAWNGTTGSWVNLGQIGAAFPDAPDDGRLYGREAAAGPGTPMDWESIIDDGAY